MLRTDAFTTPTPTLAAAPTLLSRLGGALAAWHRIYCTRRVIMELDAHLLRDIGIEAPVTDSRVRRILLLG